MLPSYLVIATIVQMIVLKLKYGVIEKQQKIMAIAVIFFGLLTAYFNEIKYHTMEGHHY